MEFFENMYGWLEDSNGWTKTLIIGILVVLGLAGFFGWNIVKNFTGVFNTPTEELTKTAKEVFDTGKKQIEEQKKQLINEGEEALNELEQRVHKEMTTAKEVIDTGKEQKEQFLDESEEAINELEQQMRKKITDALNTFKR